MPEKVKVGVIGCGAISPAYLGMAKNFPIVEMAAAADIDESKAKAAAEKYGIPKVCSPEELLNDKSIEIVLNLTVPKFHTPIGIQAIRKGKHTYCEKPLGVDRKEGLKLMKLAEEKGLMVGCAPDTFMGAGIQTARKVLDEGIIGRPVVATAFMLGAGHESWHPSPEFYYEVGGGPMFDMGPYYLTALLNLLGPVKRVSGIAGIQIPERTITSQPKHGKKIKVETPDHVAGTMEFQNGVICTMVQSFAMKHAPGFGGQPIMIYGEKGALKVPDPNGFDGPVHVHVDGEKDWREIPHQFVKGYGRSVGLADMAYAIRSGRKMRANGQQAMAVLDLMQSFLDSSTKGKAIETVTPYERPAAMPANLPFGQLDE